MFVERTHAVLLECQFWEILLEPRVRFAHLRIPGNSLILLDPRSGAYAYIRVYAQYAVHAAAGPAILCAIRVHIHAYSI